MFSGQVTELFDLGSHVVLKVLKKYLILKSVLKTLKKYWIWPKCA